MIFRPKASHSKKSYLQLWYCINLAALQGLPSSTNENNDLITRDQTQDDQTHKVTQACFNLNKNLTVYTVYTQYYKINKKIAFYVSV